MRWFVLVAWLIVGAAVWNGFYDLYVSRGAREYLQLSAEAELGRRPPPSMKDVMDANERAGRRAATIWALLVTGAGWGTAIFARASRPGRA
jgi:hypothetical protein